VRIAILSDIHEDLRNLKRVLKKIDQKGCDIIICLGDISGFSTTYYSYGKSRNASACLELIRNKCEVIIPGNHDLHAAGTIPLLPAGATYEYWPHEEDLDPGYSREEIDFLSGLPKFAILPAPGYNVFLSHYLEPNLSGYIKGFYDSGREAGSHFQLMKEHKCEVGFTGHTHVGGFYTLSPAQFKSYGYRRHRLQDFPMVVGIPPVTRNNSHAGFCIFETVSKLLQVNKLY